MNPQLFLAFVIVAVTLACTPGVDWAYSIAAGLRQRSFLPAVAGLCSGYVLHTALLVAGLAAVLTGVPGLLGWLTIAGAAYLLWLGVSTMRSWRGASFSADDAVGQSRNQLRTFLQGMGTSGINPKGLLFFLALVPQFVSPEASLPVPVQSGVLGLTFVLFAGIIYTVVALGSRKLLQSRPSAARVVTLASGIIMVGLGAVLLGEQLLPMLR
ncbi:homoserine/homoserine lactone efflux protein [Arthrobacter sp. Hiyo8]|jgi:threonine/homoserine/homoserine lactone efflux protein|uniref:Threonine/homoserine/homoserine lactone efflux protein n=1 Tax=Arthrobacter bambusae TaxID=1338426 RepID=A0AAW8DDU8_9MICC|nr:MULTISPECIES: LysE family translocator [Arthrobacter]BAS15529.1 homoserine/homoserine lactone efflux protein [Arthrobacter sp. Hiyo8]MDP9907001.1 threonine/homoserine/homoserine lactone efflux protein [Arthrobacter bambusae]MDQ0130680.1 threonine/homoserine/homoserine lactone efflux protein [Arthrobacter bambusae]MDQ0182069.1 threonine/homoserine/homoserine lactone efflux protein [Arthrobacter bambusae]GAP59298.1 homoserine/homoserine lactone efflux protein [Arthrobacter sp. Hiyo1]